MYDSFTALLAGWSKHNPTFWESHDPPHGNAAHATSEELAGELECFLDEGDASVAWSGPELSAEYVATQLETLLKAQRSGAAHGVSRVRGQWRATGERQGEELTLWRVVAKSAARRVGARSKPELSPSEQVLRAAFAWCAATAGCS